MPAERRPLGGYLVTMLAYGAVVLGTATGRRLPRGMSTRELVGTALAAG